MSRTESSAFGLDGYGMGLDNPSESLTIRKLQAEKAALQQSLNEATVKLFNRSLDDDQVTDAIVQQEFEHLRSSTASWIEDAFDCSNPQAFRKRWKRLSHRYEKPLRHLGLPDNLFRPKHKTSSGSIVTPNDRMSWLGGCNNCQCLIATLVIWQALEQQIFAEQWPIGASTDKNGDRIQDQDNQSLMHEVFEIMTEAKDEISEKISIRFWHQLSTNTVAVDSSSDSSLWRSETVKAMARVSNFKEKQDRATERLLHKLIEDLRELAGSSPFDGQKLRAACLDPAISLHNSIVCSRQTYRVSWPGFEQQPPDLGLRKWEMKDIATWIPPSKASRDLVPVLALVPCLHTQRIIDGRPIILTLVKPTAVVCKSEEVNKANEALRQSTSSSGRSHGSEKSSSLQSSRSASGRQRSGHSSRHRHNGPQSISPSRTRSEPQIADVTPTQDQWFVDGGSLHSTPVTPCVPSGGDNTGNSDRGDAHGSGESDEESLTTNTQEDRRGNGRELSYEAQGCTRRESSTAFDQVRHTKPNDVINVIYSDLPRTKGMQRNTEKDIEARY